MRYKRYKKRSNSTRSVMMKFQSFMDINTKADEMQIISVNAGGKELIDRLPAFFSAYKYYKIGNISVKLVPASTLPVDPTGLSYEAGEQTVDPRDQLTPGMMRITNGEDVFEDITGMSAENQHKLYNSMLLDPRWFKWMLQSGVKRHAKPIYWQIGQLHQDKWPGATINIPDLSARPDTGEDPEVEGTSYEQFFTVAASDTPYGNPRANLFLGQSSPYGLFQTGHRGFLGWLPTDGLQNLGYQLDNVPLLTSPPEIEVMKIVLPPAYKTEYYYRMFVTQTVYFREPVVQAIGITDFPYRPLDVFHIQTAPYPYLPSDGTSMAEIMDDDTGGNYGDD